MDTLFYDGKCPLCAREINLLRKLETGNLVFADVHAQQNRKGLLPGKEQLLRRLHLLTGDGHWEIGLRATVKAWSHTRLGFLFKPLLWPVIHPIASALYGRWADRRFQKKYQCSACVAET